jgi:hypothetical protein
VVPQVTVENSHCLNARQLTLFYRLLPYLCRIRAKARPKSGIENSCQTAVIGTLANKYNIFFSMAWVKTRAGIPAK